MYNISQSNYDLGLNSDKELFSKINFDLFICASGFETRSTFQARHISNVGRKICIGFNNEIDNLVRKENDDFFIKNKFEIINCSVEDNISENIGVLIKDIDKVLNYSRELNVFIDYSSMTKNWYSYLLLGMFNLKNRSILNIYFGYSHAEYVKSNISNTLNRIVNPLFGYCNLSLPSSPTSLIIGLGNEPNRVFGLIEYFDAIPFIFHTDSSFNSNYKVEIESISKDILNEIPIKNVFEYPINDLLYTHYILENLCKELLQTNRVIIAPCGPKPFTLISLLLSLKYENTIEVWRISPGVKLPIVDRKPNGNISILKISFTS